MLKTCNVKNHCTDFHVQLNDRAPVALAKLVERSDFELVGFEEHQVVERERVDWGIEEGLRSPVAARVYLPILDVVPHQVAIPRVIWWGLETVKWQQNILLSSDTNHSI